MRRGRKRPSPISAAIMGIVTPIPAKKAIPTTPLLDLVLRHGKRAAVRLAQKSERVSGCLVWTGSKNRTGYGRMSLGKAEVLAHRVAWVLANHAEIAPGMFVCHACDNPACIEPDHLWVGSGRDNMTDMYRKGRGATTRLRGGRVIAAHLLPEFQTHLHRKSS